MKTTLRLTVVAMTCAAGLAACGGIPGDINPLPKTTPTAPPMQPATQAFVEAQCKGVPGTMALCGVLDPLPDRLPVLSAGVLRGALVVAEVESREPSKKLVDGKIGDWIGAASHFGGSARWDAGEYIYSDYLFDSYGADDGVDQRRDALLDPLAEFEPRTVRLDQLFQALGDQFGAPPPLGALDRYGDTTGLDAQADLSEVRWAADAEHAYLLARMTTMADDAAPALLVLLDTREGPASEKDVGFATGLRSSAFDSAVLITRGGITLRDLASGEEHVLSGAQVAYGAQGWDNAIEAALPVSLFADVSKVAVISGPAVEGGLTPANLAYRFHEPIAGVYNDKRQALDLLTGNIDRYAVELALADLRGGRSQSARPGPGYYERQFVSGENISREDGENGVLQPYGLYVPTAYDPANKSPLTIWMHYRGGKAHSGAAWTPRLINELGEEQDNIVVTPRGRGTSTWYVTQAHQDFFEVFADVHGLLNIDEDRRYLSGYSMGGYGTYLFGLMYPDLFAAGYSTSGAVTQGAWTGIGPDNPLCDMKEFEIPSQGLGNACFIEANEGNSDAQLTYRILENALHFPITIHHGGNDELVPITGIQVTALKLALLGYRYDLHTFIGYEHYTQAIIDEWGDGAIYLNQFRRDPNPRKVVYKIVPALVRATNTVRANDVVFNFKPDGAYWARDLVVSDPEAEDPAIFGMIEAESLAIPAPRTLALPTTADGASTPVFSPGQHSTPFVRHGMAWLELGQLPVSNGFNATLTGLAAASLDTARMQLDPGQRIDGAVQSDGPATLTLTGLSAPVQATVNGAPVDARVEGGRLQLPLAAGASEIVLLPAAE